VPKSRGEKKLTWEKSLSEIVLLKLSFEFYGRWSEGDLCAWI